MRVSRLFFALLVLPGLVSELHASDPASEARKRMTERTGGGTGVISSSQRKSVPVVTYITYVSPERQWVSSDGRKMSGRLAAFSAPKPGETGAVVVIQEGKIRLVRSGTKKAAEFPLTNLSEEDQLYTRRIAEAAKKMGAPAETPPAEE